MAKEKGEKTNLYLLSIVSIVAIVGIAVLILNSGAGSVSLSGDDLSGEAIKTGSTSKLSGISALKTGSTASSGVVVYGTEGQCCRRLNNGCDGNCYYDSDGNCPC